MDSKSNVLQQDNPRAKANFLSVLFFWWLHPFLKLGYKRLLQLTDLYRVLPGDGSEELGLRLQKEWNAELLKEGAGKYKASLTKAIWRVFGFEFVGHGLLIFIEECILKVAQPICLGRLVLSFQDPDPESTWKGYLWGTGVILSCALTNLTHHPYFYGVQHCGMRIRVACCSLVYKKCLKLSQKALCQTTVGQVVNLLSNDVNRFDFFVLFLHYFWVGPIQTVISMIILLYVIGPSCLIGLGVLILFVPLQSWMGRAFSRLRMKTARKTDERIRAMNEMISGMRVIKMFAWEKPFGQVIDKCRRKEVDVIRKAAYLRSLNMSLFFTASKLIVFLTFVAYVLTGNALTSGKVFLCVSLFNNIRLSMTLFFPSAITQAAESLVSIKRIQNFLELDESVKQVSVTKQDRPLASDCGIWLDHLTAKWPSSNQQEENTLTDISLSLKPGQLLAIVGQVGSGKSTLLNVLLGELSARSGSVKVEGKMSYSCQEPWIFSGTIRQNILCGQKYDSKRYRKVVKVCALEKDFSILPEGDATPVGERGVSLSGGQKARVNLARSLYIDADIYLMDDPLSAVDAHVGRHLFDQSIVQFLRNKIRVLATHQLQYLKDCDQILILKAGRIEALGTYEELVASGVDFTKHISTEDEEEEQERSPSFSESELEASMIEGSFSSFRRSMRGSVKSVRSVQSVASLKEQKVAFAEESRAEGVVSKAVYWKYFRAGGGYFYLLVMVLNVIVGQFLFTGADFWLSVWTKAEDRRSRNDPVTWSNTTENATVLFNDTLAVDGFTSQETNVTIGSWLDNMDTNTGVHVYTGLVVGLFFFSFIRTVHFSLMCMNSSVNLHNQMFAALLRAPLLFFDQNPVGRVLNRFSKDTGCMDEILPPAMFDAIVIFSTFIGIFFLVGWVNMWLLVPFVFLFIVFYFFQKFYMQSARSVKRLEATGKSPVFTHVSSTLIGLSTVRAQAAQEIFQGVFDQTQDVHSSAWYMFLATTRWFGLWIDWISVFYLTVLVYTCIGFRDSIASSEAGLAVSSALWITGALQWGIRQATEVENHMTSVERVIDYSRLTPEAPAETAPDKKPPASWPSKGTVRFEKMCLRYREMDEPVLKDITCSIRDKEKIGIVGRTGAGKSSLIASLFRLAEPEGSIYIDGVDTKTLGLDLLRSNISIIPQDPVLFSGTLRKNLDYFGEYSDEQLWNVLESVKLKEAVSDLSAGLDSVMAEGGANLSVGQRQLVCLARAILKRNRVLVLDEATANVDPKTDALIQQTIRTEFQHFTVLTIAHRLDTIMDCDRVMVLDAGYLKEMDEPVKLLEKPNSMFYALVEQTGKASADYLTEIARKAAKERISARTVSNGAPI